jgi:4-amino-4-deoxy-L-arabinose transferase-like glycosyltransferase
MRAAQIASVLFVLEPYFIFWSGLAMAEVFFLFFLLYTMYALFDAILHEKKWSYLLSGFFFGIASLTRPVLLPFFFLLMPILVWLFRRKLRAQLVSIAFLVVGFAIIVAPWSLRNHRLFGSWNISSVGSYNLIFYDSALSLSTYNHIPWDDTIAYLQGRVSQSCSNLITYTSLRYESRLTHTFLELVKENPIAFAKMRVKNIASVLLNDGYNHIGRFLSVSIPFWTRIIGILFWASQYVLIVIYVFSQDFQKLSKNQKYFIFILLSMIAYFAFATGAVASARYRIPIAPFIFLLSSSSISLVYKKIKLHL